MVVQGRLEIVSMNHGVLVYKGRQSCTEFSIEFSCVNPIQGFIHWPTLISLSHNSFSGKTLKGIG